MSLLRRLFGNTRSHERARLIPLYNAIVSRGRLPHWYLDGQVPDSVDGRFDMIAALLAITMLRLEEVTGTEQQSAHLTEIFVEDMDGQLREIGIGDMVVGKHIGRMMASLGGRLAAFRDAFAGKAEMDDVLQRNIYRGCEVDSAAMAHAKQSIHAFHDELAQLTLEIIIAGEIAPK